MILLFYCIFIHVTHAFCFHEYNLDKICNRDLWYLTTSSDRKENLGWNHITVEDCLYKKERAKRIVNKIYSKLLLPWPFKEKTFMTGIEVYVTRNGVQLYKIARTDVDGKDKKEKWSVERDGNNYTYTSINSKGKVSVKKLNASFFDRLQIEGILQDSSTYKQGWEEKVRIYNPVRDKVTEVFNFFDSKKKVKIDSYELTVTVLKSKVDTGNSEIWLDEKGIMIYSVIRGSKYGIRFSAMTELSPKNQVETIFPESTGIKFY